MLRPDVPIKTKRWNDPAEPDDGTRILVCRYRPRALRKELETWSAWQKELGPSVALHADFYGKHGPPIAWPEYRERYLEEMRARGALIDELARRSASGETLCLLCSKACVDEAHCHRSLLRELIEARQRELPRSRSTSSDKPSARRRSRPR
jgi:uncharacterized protein YeaO (DUF488 family)